MPALPPARFVAPAGMRPPGEPVRRNSLAFILCALSLAACNPSIFGPPEIEISLPLKPGSVRFAVIGDLGTGDRFERAVAERMLQAHGKFPFQFVITDGDNLYGGDSEADFHKRFEAPYQPLLALGVRFRASLGNHDGPRTLTYPALGMNGARYYTFREGNAAFFALDSNRMDGPQLDWLKENLAASSAAWNICYFHHPLYSSAKYHGPSPGLRKLLEPLFVAYGVQVVFSGHDHVYERSTPHQGIVYFTEGASGQLRAGDLRPSSETAAGFDKDRSFMLVEIAGDEFHFEAISRTGAAVDSGVIERESRAKAPPFGRAARTP